MHSRILSASPVVLLLAIAPLARASFVNGVETFDGPQLDSQTWMTSAANGSPAFTQNHALNILAATNTSPLLLAGCETKDPLVPVGGSVWAEVTVTSSTLPASYVSSTALLLTTKLNGVEFSLDDFTSFQISAPFSTSAPSTNIGTSQLTQLNALGTTWGGSPLALSQFPFGVTHIFQIERLSDSLVRFCLFKELGAASDGGINITLVGSTTMNKITNSDPMHVLLKTTGTDTTFDTVTLNNPVALTQTEIYRPVAVPLPTSAAFLSPLALLLLRPARRTTFTAGKAQPTQAATVAAR